MTSFITFLTSIGGLIVALFACLIWLWRRPASRGGRRVLVSVVVIYALASLWPVPYAASRLLTYRYQPLRAAEVATGRTVIVLLGAGHGWLRDWDRTPFPLIDAVELSRVAEAARVFRMAGDAWIISSGGASERSIWPDSEVMRGVLISQQVPASRILLESGSATTRDEAVLIAPMLAELHADRVVLVTSATHMPRSMGTFRAVGVNAIPAVARDPVPAMDWEFWLEPDVRALRFSSAVVREYLGIVKYAARGWYRARP